MKTSLFHRYSPRSPSIAPTVAVLIGLAGLYSTVALFPVESVRWIVGLFALIILPGIIITTFLFYGRQPLGFGERFSFAVGLGFVFFAVVAFLVTTIPWQLEQISILMVTGVLVAIAVVLLAFRVKVESTVNDHRTIWNRLVGFAYSHLKMSPPDIMKSRIVRILPLLAVLAIGYWITFMPHADYRLPIHVDEWFHLTYFKAIQSEDSILASDVPAYDFPDPDTGDITPGTGDLEPAFHLIWSGFQAATDVGWYTLFRFLPGVIFVFTLISIYTLASKKGYGLETTILSLAIPTTVSVLGPSFLVPVALGMLVFSVALVLIFFDYRSPGLCVLLGLTVLLPFVHFPTAVALAVVGLPYSAIILARTGKNILIPVVIILLPMVIAFPMILSVVPDLGGSLIQRVHIPHYLPYLPDYLLMWGYPFLILFIIGMILMVMKPQMFGISVVATSLFLLIHNYTFASWGTGLQILYHRGPLYLTILASIIGGYTLWHVRWWFYEVVLREFFSGKQVVRIVLSTLPVALILGITMYTTVGRHAEEPFYYMINHQEAEDFQWIVENVPNCYDTAILDPWKATAFTAITGRNTYVRIHHGPGEEAQLAYNFLAEGASDTSFLERNGITLVYSFQEVNNENLEQISEGIYVLQGYSC